MSTNYSHDWQNCLPYKSLRSIFSITWQDTSWMSGWQNNTNFLIVRSDTWIKGTKNDVKCLTFAWRRLKFKAVLESQFRLIIPVTCEKAVDLQCTRGVRKMVADSMQQLLSNTRLQSWRLKQGFWSEEIQIRIVIKNTLSVHPMSVCHVNFMRSCTKCNEFLRDELQIKTTLHRHARRGGEVS